MSLTIRRLNANGTILAICCPRPVEAAIPELADPLLCVKRGWYVSLGVVTYDLVSVSAFRLVHQHRVRRIAR